MRLRLALTYPHALGIPGGGTVHCHRLALELASEGADVSVVPVGTTAMSLAPRETPKRDQLGGALQETLVEAGIDVRPVRQNSLAWWFDGLAVRRELLALDREHRLDAVLGWWGELAFALPALARREIFTGVLAAAPYSLWWEREYGRPRWLHRCADDWVVARTSRRADRVFANSRHIASQVTDLLGVDGGKVEIVPPPLDRRFTRIPRTPAGPVERLLYFGRLRPKKGVFDLVRALEHLTDREWRLRIVGAGDRDGVVRAVEERGISRRTEISGPADAAGIDAHLTWAQLVVLPSYEESFGLAVAEAQLAGRAVIAYDIGSVAEIHRHGESGWMVPVGRIDRLARAIREALLDDQEVRRRGRRARERATDTLLGESSGSRILRSIERSIRDPA